MLCPNCQTEKETKDFRRYASLAQTRSWLRNPNAQRRLEYVGKVCNTCSKEVKRNSKELTPAEYERRLINEGKHQVVIDELVRSRVKQGKEKLRAGALRALKIQRKPLFTPMIEEVQTLVRTLKRRTKTKDATTPFLLVCLGEATISLRQLRALKTRASVPPSCWQKLMRKEDHDRVRAAYDALDDTQQRKLSKIYLAMRIPVAHRDENQPKKPSGVDELLGIFNKKSAPLPSTTV